MASGDKSTSIPTPVELHVTIGELWLMMGELELAAKAFQQALKLLHQMPDPSPLMRSRAPIACWPTPIVCWCATTRLSPICKSPWIVLDELALRPSLLEQPVKQVSHISWYPGRTAIAARLR